jgi:hypothetical protein
MNTTHLRRPLWALATALSLGFSGLTLAEPPSRAARLGYLSGSVSFSPAGEADWVRARVNRPLTTGDRLWTDDDSRAEVQLGGAAIRMGPSTSMVLLNLDDRITQVQLSQGTLKVRVRSFGPRQTFEVATPNLAFTLSRPGEYRIEVDPNDDATAVVVHRGEAEVYGDGASYTVDARRAYRFYGTDLSDYDVLTARRDDDLDRWSRERDRRGDASVSARYVSSEVVGYEDLDVHGTWRVDATYGNVWIPRRVSAGWTPYRDGHWAWIDPWGWTWVDDAPWGYAVSHYGRWAYIGGTWAWVPGPRAERAVYAPALVAFVGGSNFQISVTVGNVASAIGWFPLAPREVYQPSYPVSRVYFDNINRSNAVIAPTTITNIYNTTIVNNTTNITNVTYANRQISGAVVAVPTQTFVQSQPVAKATVRVAPAAVLSAPVVRMASVAPVQQSVQGGAPNASSKPPSRERNVVARTAPPPAAVPFAVQQKQLADKPGRPIDDGQRTQLIPATPAAAAPKVSVVATAPTPTATALPPATPPAGRSAQARKAASEKANAAGGDTRKPVEDRAAGAKPQAPAAEELKATPAQAEAAKAAEARADEAKAEADKAASAKDRASKADEAKADKARRDAARADDAKAEAVKAEAVRADAARVAESKADAARAEAAKADASRAAAANAAAARAGAAKEAEDKADAARAADAKAKSNAGKADEDRAQKAKGEAARAEAVKAQAMQTESARAEAAKAANARAEAAKADAMKAEAARADAAKGAAAKAENARAEAAKAEAARADAAKAAQAKTEAAKEEAVKANAAKAEAKKAEAARVAQAPLPAAAPPPKARGASSPKSDADAAEEEEEKKKGGRKP